MTVMDIRGKVVIAGSGESRIGRVPGISSLGLHAEAAKAALEDAGLDKSEVDGILTNGSYYDYHVRPAMAFAEYFGIHSTARFISTNPLGSAAASGLMLHEAAALILSGMCETVLVVSADNFLSALGSGGAVGALAANRDKEFEAPYAPILPACFAMVAKRYMYETGVTSEALAAVAVNQRAHAAKNSKAQTRDEITIQNVLDSPLVAEPFHRLDCSLISDGGGAVVVTTAERARRLKRPPIYLRGASNINGDGRPGRMYQSLAQSRDLTRLGTERTVPEALAAAGVTRKDIDVLCLYDPFTIMPILHLESAGFAARGKAGAMALGGELRVGGNLPVNPHGGLLSYCHPGNPGAFFMITEMVRQLRHEAENQVQGAEVGMLLGYGGELAIWPVTVLSNQP
jgi:acetyl-CoA acetyltransferase